MQLQNSAFTGSYFLEILGSSFQKKDSFYWNEYIYYHNLKSSILKINIQIIQFNI